jgi:hypothetical protein
MNEITLFLERLARELNIAGANIVEIYDDYREHCILPAQIKVMKAGGR